MNFGEALEIVKKGGCVSRKLWEDENILLFLRPSDSIKQEIVVNNVKSLPQSLKNVIGNKETLVDVENEVGFSAYLCLYTGKNIVNGWLPTNYDMLAEDWIDISL